MTDWQLCTSGAAIAKAGANANATIIASGSTLLQWYTEAEGSISLEIHTDATSLQGVLSGSLADICSSKIAMKMIQYDSTGYSSREADNLLNVNFDIISKGITNLKSYSKIKQSSPI